MATSKLQGVFSKGSKGDTTFYERRGQIVARQRHAKRGRTERTARSMANKTRWLNVVHSWTAFAGGLKGNFEKLKPGQTEFNAFTSLNMLDARVFLTKREAELRGCVADRFAVSLGSLSPRVEVRAEEGWMVSDLEVGDFEVGAGTRVCDLAAVLVEQSRGRLRWGDEIRFYFTENLSGGADAEVPVFAAYGSALPLRKEDGRRLEEVSPRRIWELGGWMVRHGRLAFRARRDCLVAWVVRRRDERGRWLCTCQHLVGVNSLWEVYATEEARAKAIASYGPLRDEDGGLRGLPPVVDAAGDFARRELSPAQRLVADALREAGGAGPEEVAERVGLPVDVVVKLMKEIEL